MIDWSTCHPEDLEAVQHVVKRALELGYMPKRSATKDFMVTFHHKAHSRILLKLAMAKTGRLHVHLRFSACTDYPESFRQAIDEDLSGFKDRYAGCFAGCSRCEIPIGYTITTSRGTLFRCHQELVDLGALSRVDLEDVFRCLVVQHDAERLRMKPQSTKSV
jgi:hypothetical protein